MDIRAELSEASELINLKIKEEFSSSGPDFSELLDAEAYSLLAGGKRLRPFLVLKTCALFGGKEEAAIPLALAIEMVHTYSLIHDDLPCMDNDDLRRGMPTCHKKYGEAIALLAGDGLLTRAFSVVASADGLSPEMQITAIRVLADACGDRGMLAGQVMDERAEHERIDEETLLRLHSLKTAAMIKASCLLGMIAAGILPHGDDPRVKAVTEYAESIGIAFQVIDDVLDVTGDEKTLGKTIGSDKEQGKTTFMSFMTVSDAERYAVELTETAVSSIGEYDRSGVLTALAYYLCDRKH